MQNPSKTSVLGPCKWQKRSTYLVLLPQAVVELVRNLMAHAQKPHFVFRLKGWVHLNRRGSQFSRLLAADVCASALVMLDTLGSEVVWEYWLPTPFASFPFTSPPVRHRVPSGFKRTLLVEFCVWVSVHHKLIYIKNQRDATWQYVY